MALDPRCTSGRGIAALGNKHEPCNLPLIEKRYTSRGGTEQVALICPRCDSPDRK